MKNQTSQNVEKATAQMERPSAFCELEDWVTEVLEDTVFILDQILNQFHEHWKLIRELDQTGNASDLFVVDDVHLRLNLEQLQSDVKRYKKRRDE